MTPVYSFELKQGQDGRIIEKTETVNGKVIKWAYTYDKDGRLYEAKLGNRLICQCRYDKQGRRSQDYFPRKDKQVRNHRYTMDNRLQQAGNNGYTHDKQGFRSIWNHEGKYTSYEYALDYRLLKTTKEAEGIAFEFTHDDNGQRQIKNRNGEMVEAYFWLDFLRLGLFYDGENGYRFVYNEGERMPYAMQRQDGVVTYLYYDQVGSLRVVADESGNVIKEILYDPFGGIMEESNPDLRIPIGFAGGLHDRDLGFVRFGWRDYDTFTSRWTAPDPIGDAGGDPDWYGYCLDDPINAYDPTGLNGWGFGGGGHDFPSGNGGDKGTGDDNDSDRGNGGWGFGKGGHDFPGGLGASPGTPGTGSDNGGRKSDSESLNDREARTKTSVQTAQEIETYAAEKAKEEQQAKHAEDQEEARQRMARRASLWSIAKKGALGAAGGVATGVSIGIYGGPVAGTIGGVVGGVIGGVMGLSGGLVGGTLGEAIDKSNLSPSEKSTLHAMNDIAS